MNNKTGSMVYAKITGRGEFPIDMLRYDLCSPATEEDSNLIRRTFYGLNYNWIVIVKRPLLERRLKNNPVFTYGRWQSFGCNIVEVNSCYESRMVKPEVIAG